MVAGTCQRRSRRKATTEATVDKAAPEYITLKDQLSDPFWRWANLYWILDEEGNRVKFSLRPAISNFVRDMHSRNIILKARQHGFSTFLLIYILDSCLFTSGLAAAVVAHRMDAAKRLFRSKIRYPYNNLPEQLRRHIPVITGGNQSIECSASQEVEFGNGSTLIADVSVRSGTYQIVHLSEFGILCSDSPQRAAEVQSGTLETAHANSIVFIESTAKGAVGPFYQICRAAQQDRADGIELGKLDYKFHFYGWWINPSYVSDARRLPDIQTEADIRYFASVERSQGITLSPEQRSWYLAKKRTLKSQIRAEYPSTPAEAFEATIIGSYYGEIMDLLQERDQIAQVPHMPGYKVHTAWDIGYTTAVWFWQQVGVTPHVIRYYEAQGLSMDGWARLLDGYAEELGYRYGEHFAPFDTITQNGVKIITGQGILDAAEAAGIRFHVLDPEVSVKEIGIPRTQDMLPLCYFDRDNCSQGIACLRIYREAVNKSMSTDDCPVYLGKPEHGPESHGADAFRYLSMSVPLLKPEHHYETERRSHNELCAMYGRPC